VLLSQKSKILLHHKDTSSLILRHHFSFEYDNHSSGCIIFYPSLFCPLKGLKRHPSPVIFTLLLCPWCSCRCAARGKSLRTRQVLTVSLQYPGSKPQHLANIPKHHIRVAVDGCFHSLQMGISYTYQMSFILLLDVCRRLSWL